MSFCILNRRSTRCKKDRIWLERVAAGSNILDVVDTLDPAQLFSSVESFQYFKYFQYFGDGWHGGPSTVALIGWAIHLWRADHCWVRTHLDTHITLAIVYFQLRQYLPIIVNAIAIAPASWLNSEWWLDEQFALRWKEIIFVCDWWQLEWNMLLVRTWDAQRAVGRTKLGSHRLHCTGGKTAVVCTMALSSNTCWSSVSIIAS